MIEPREFSLYRAGELMRRGRLSAEALVLSCLEKIEARQADVRAWVEVYPGQALEEARRLDGDAARSRWHGPLHGIPLGIKDIIDVEGMATRGGTEVYEGGVAGRDAACVARLRGAGAIFLGKLATTAFAYGDPVPDARNPWNLERTPGGSSAGSGAAVADRMCLGALGTQTGGSVLRPAAFTGVVGFKPSFGAISLEGVIPLSWSMDHVGAFARRVEDANLLWHVMRDQRTLDWQTTRQKMAPPLVPRAPLRVWRVRDFFESEADPEIVENLERACVRLAGHGVQIVEKPLPPSSAGVKEAHQCILEGDAAAYHRERFEEKKLRYPPRVGRLVEQGLQVRAADYVAAQRLRLRWQTEMAAALAEVDLAIMPTSLTPPPDPSTTGDPAFNSPWSMCGIPTLSLPTHVNGDNLPLAVQLVAGRGEEERLLRMGAWCESLFGFSATPGG